MRVFLTCVAAAALGAAVAVAKNFFQVMTALDTPIEL